MRSQRGLHGLFALVLDSVGMWLVIILTGAGIGVLGAWLDVLVRWYVPCRSVVDVNPAHVRCSAPRRLGDLREGRCTYGFFYNQVACCSGLDRECIYQFATVTYASALNVDGIISAGEICNEWQSWSEYLHVSSTFGQSLLQAIIYIALSVSCRAYST